VYAAVLTGICLYAACSGHEINHGVETPGAVWRPRTSKFLPVFFGDQFVAGHDRGGARPALISADSASLYHLHDISMASGNLDCLRMTYVFESWYP
jgi:hypothetical protein